MDKKKRGLKRGAEDILIEDRHKKAKPMTDDELTLETEARIFDQEEIEEERDELKRQLEQEREKHEFGEVIEAVEAVEAKPEGRSRRTMILVFVAIVVILVVTIVCTIVVDFVDCILNFCNQSRVKNNLLALVCIFMPCIWSCLSKVCTSLMTLLGMGIGVTLLWVIT